MCTEAIICFSAAFTSGEHSIWKSSRNLDDTPVSASSGHGKYQSIVQPLMMAGN